jgi:hypothetical protein
MHFLKQNTILEIFRHPHNKDIFMHEHLMKKGLFEEMDARTFNEMESDIGQYFPPDSIFNVDDDCEENDVYTPRGNFMSSPQKKDQSINKYFSQTSIFLSDEEANDKEEEEEQVIKRLTPKSPRRNVNLQDLEKFILSGNEGRVVSRQLDSSTPTIKIEEYNDSENSPDEIIYDTPRPHHNIYDTPPPLPKKKRHTLAVSTEEGQIYRQSQSDPPTSKRGSCPGFLGTWERDSWLYQKYENLLANEGLQHSPEYELVSRASGKQRVSKKKSLKDMLLTVFPNRIFLSVSDSEIDKTGLTNKNDSHLSPKKNDKGTLNLRTVKDKMSSKYKDIRSVFCAEKTKRKGDLFQCVATLCVPAGCSNVSSMVGYDHGQCWVAAEASESILLYNKAGDLLDFVNVGCPVDSLTVDKDGNVFMSCPDLKQVRVFDRNRHVSIFIFRTCTRSRSRKVA